MKKKITALIISIAIPLSLSGLATVISKNGISKCFTLTKPFFSLPDIVYFLIWWFIYVLIGVASYLLYTSNADIKKKKTALHIYCLQIFINFVLPIVFFNFNAYYVSFLLLLILIALGNTSIIYFVRVSKGAATLFIPYILILLYTLYLSYGLYALN